MRLLAYGVSALVCVSLLNSLIGDVFIRGYRFGSYLKHRIPLHLVMSRVGRVPLSRNIATFAYPNGIAVAQKKIYGRMAKQTRFNGPKVKSTRS